jgi:hypothetical protein
MSSAIAIRTQSDTELVFDINDGNFQSFILQVRDPQSPGLLQRLQEALAHLGSETNVVPVEAHPDYMSSHITAHYQAPVGAATAHPKIMAEGTLPDVLRGAGEMVVPLRGKAGFTPHVDTGEFIAVINAVEQKGDEATREALARGEVRLVQWTRDGTLVDGRQLCDAWGLTRQGLDKARERGEIFSVRVKGLHYYPAEAAHFARDDLARINRELGDIDPARKLVFLKRKHGALAGGTAAEAVEKGRLMDVLRLAKDWASN